MARDKKIWPLSIYLVKARFTSIEQIIERRSCEAPIQVPIAGHGVAQLFIKKSPPAPPKWVGLFEGVLDPRTLVVPGVSAALAIRVSDRWFVLTFGQSGRFLLMDDVCEERFGLLCALNSVNPDTFRCVDVQSLDAIQSHSRIQSGQETTAEQFGLDVEQDMLKAIVGAPLNPAHGQRMAGSDSLSVSVRMELADLPFLLDEYRERFEADLSAENHQWANNISITRNADVTNALEAALNEKLQKRAFDGMWLAIPEIIDWSVVTGFMYAGSKGIHSDITLQGFLSEMKRDIGLDLKVFRRRKVYCSDADHNPVFKFWPAYKCLYAEIDLNGDKYILNDGKWFRVASDFVSKTDADFAKIPPSKLRLPTYSGGGEGAYNASVAGKEPERFALLDNTQKIMHGGGHGQVEVCDLLSTDRELIHVKIYGKSNVFSQLFAQGFVSGQLIQIDPEFRRKIHEKLKPLFADLIQAARKPTDSEFTIVYAIISEEQGDRLHLPFFSRVNLNNTSRVLRGLGYSVELLKIPVDPMYARTTRYPPRKSRSEKRP